MKNYLVSLAIFFSLCAGSCKVEVKTLFPTDLPSKEWVQFKAEGFSKPACGVIYRTNDKVTNGMAIGGFDTGCLDLEPTGLLGYSSIFNNHIPRLGPINLPILGISISGKTWVLCKDQPKEPEYIGWPKGPAEPVLTSLDLDGVETAKEIHYWGHYPVADLEFETDSPVSVGMRAWSSFLPGDIDNSMVPGSVFQVHLRNTSDRKQEGTVAFTFPGPTQKEAGCRTFQYKKMTGNPMGLCVIGRNASYTISVLDESDVRNGGQLADNGKAWSAIAHTLPAIDTFSAGASVAIDFSLARAEEKTVRFLLTWHSPKWKGSGRPVSEKRAIVNEAWLCPDGSRNDRSIRIADMTYKKHNRSNPATFDYTLDVAAGQRVALYFRSKDGMTTDYSGAEMKVELLEISDNSSPAGIKVGNVWDLKRDWSNEKNPNGQWEYGTISYGQKGPAVSLVGDWRPNSLAGTTANPQPAWSISQAQGFGMAKIINDKPFDGDSKLGDIVAVGEWASYLWPSVSWISPAHCKIRVTGETWMVRGVGFGDAVYTHMYTSRYPDAVSTAKYLAKNHRALMRRTLAWQQVVYTDDKLPVWLRESLINILYCISECGMWAQKTENMPAWVKNEDGIFGMNECPRGCPQMECIPCSFYGSLPLVYFFPELQLSTIRAYMNYQRADGCPAWIFGPEADVNNPSWHSYQASTNGISLAGIVDRFLACRDTEDKKYTKEFYPMIKKAMEYTIFIGADSNPLYTEGEQIIAMPTKYGNKEWFEADYPGWLGCVAHVGLLHLAQGQITQRIAKNAGDEDYAKKCAELVKLGAEAMEKRLWDERGYYINFYDPIKEIKSEFVFGYQLDGEWITDFHGLPSAIPQEKVNTTLETIKRINIALSRTSAVNYANPDGTPRHQAKEGAWDYGSYSYFPPEAFMLAMNYMYQGNVPYGVEIARKMWHNIVCDHGYTWDVPNIMRGDTDSGERIYGSDYYQDMMIWSLPAAIQQKDVAWPTRPGGLVDRMLKAAKSK